MGERRFFRLNTLALVALTVLGLYFLDGGARACQGVFSGMKEEKTSLLRQQEYFRSVLSRERGIEEEYRQIQSLYPEFAGDGEGIPRLMTELDRIANESEIRIDAIRPQGDGSRLDIEWRGSWVQSLRFIRAVEARSRAVSFPRVEMRSRRSFPGLYVSAVVQYEPVPRD